MTKTTSVTILIIIIILAIAGYTYTKQTAVVVDDTQQTQEEVQASSTVTPSPTPTQPSTSKGLPKFSWTFKLSEKKDVTYTTISLTATYPDKSKTTKVIGTVEGTCSNYDDRDANAYKASDMIMCYYAGFGRYYKVVQNGTVYNVQRKEFEEASPDYNPPVDIFRTIATF